MEYAIIKSDSAEKLYNITAELINDKKVMYESFLCPYVDALIMSRPEKKNIYFSDRVIVNFDYISKNEFAEFMRDKELTYYARNQFQPSDIYAAEYGRML